MAFPIHIIVDAATDETRAHAGSVQKSCILYIMSRRPMPRYHDCSCFASPYSGSCHAIIFDELHLLLANSIPHDALASRDGHVRVRDILKGAFRPGQYLVLVVAARIFSPVTTDDPECHSESDGEPDRLQKKQEGLHADENGVGRSSEEVTLFRNPLEGDELRCVVDGSSNDEKEADLAGHEPADEKETESCVAHGGEREIPEHFGELSSEGIPAHVRLRDSQEGGCRKSP